MRLSRISPKVQEKDTNMRLLPEEFVTFTVEQQEKFDSQNFLDRFGALKAARWMHSVEIPNIVVSRGSKAKGVVRNDAQFFFKWLHDRHAERILRVMVDDYAPPRESNDDVAIEESLKDFGVMELNWKKVDLCPKVIANIGKELRRLYLYWGGSNAVLRGWCGSGAFRNLGNLEEIHLSLLPVSLSPDDAAF